MTGIRAQLATWTIALALACAAFPSHALDPRVAMGGYRHDIWTEADGAPQSVEALARTPDGWLWLSSAEAGLFRFDGVRFSRYVTRDGSTLLRRSITALRPAPDGALWIGYAYGGLSLLRDGRYAHVAGREELGSVYAIALGADGTPWIAGGKGLYRVVGGKARRVGPEEGFHGKSAHYALADRQGRIWVVGGHELLVRAPGDKAFRHVREAAENPLLLEDREGGVWLVTGKDFERIAEPPVAVPAPGATSRASSYQSLFDAQGNVWSGNCPVGLCRIRPGERDGTRFSALRSPERWDQPSQMRNLRVLAMMEDGDGSLWIGTAGGLERLRDQPVHMVPELFDRGMLAVAAHPDGSIWALDVSPVSGERRLWRVEGERVTSQPAGDAQAIANGYDGALLLAGPDGIVRHGRDGVRRIALPEGASGTVRMVAETAHGIWFRSAVGGTRRHVDGRWLAAEDGGGAVTVAGDAAGRTYLGYAKGRLRVMDGAAQREYGPRDGVVLDTVTYVHPGPELLISGEQGTQVLCGGRFRTLSFALPLDLNVVSGMVVGPDGARWLNTRPGLLRVAAGDWAAAMARPDVPMRATLYDMLDGFPGGGAENSRRQGTAFAGSDGRLWFTGRRVVAWVDPRRLPANPSTPPVEILGLEADNRPVAATGDGAVRLAVGTEDVRIDYSAPSLVIPQRVTFRYRLLGARSEWEDAGTRRSAFYTRLGPGDYTFEVAAINESGVPSAQPARLALRIPPRWTQTPWFYAGAAALLGVLGTLAYRWRLRRLAAHIEERLLVRARERERIARSLHDTFLQSVQGLVLSVHAVMMKLPGQSDIRAELDRVLARADDVLAEGREEVLGLRAGFASPAQFAVALRRDVEAAMPGSTGRLALDGIDHVAALCPEVCREVYAIAREALINGLRHTAGPVSLRMAAGAQAFVLEVADEGGGMGRHADGKEGHFGLAGMRERAAQVGGTLRIDSSPAGVTVVLTVPADLASGSARRG